MDRRELLKMIAAVTGGAFIGAEFFLSGCKNPDAGPGLEFSDNDITLLDEVGETILPKTTTPGAKEAKIGAYMKIWVNDCYTADDQKTFHEGIKKLNEACEEMCGKNFMNATPEQRKALLIKLDEEAKNYAREKEYFDAEQIKKEKEEHEKGNTGFQREKRSSHYFSMMKQMTIAGFYTSEEGRKGALRYTPVPGKFIPDLDYKTGDKIFAGLN